MLRENEREKKIWNKHVTSYDNLDILDFMAESRLIEYMIVLFYFMFILFFILFFAHSIYGDIFLLLSM